jgi:hypothetical protein
MVTGLATARMDGEIDANSVEAGRLRPRLPEAEVKLEVKGRTRARCAAGGQQEPDRGGWVHPPDRGRPAFLTVSESIPRDAPLPLADLRDRTVIAFDRRNVSGIDLDVNGDQIGVVADEPRKWRIVKPRALRADTDLISEFLDKPRARRRWSSSIDAPKSLQPYGLTAFEGHGLGRQGQGSCGPHPCWSAVRSRRRKASTSSGRASPASS